MQKWERECHSGIKSHRWSAKEKLPATPVHSKKAQPERLCFTDFLNVAFTAVAA
jgi:hypothetical protein